MECARKCLCTNFLYTTIWCMYAHVGYPLKHIEEVINLDEHSWRFKLGNRLNHQGEPVAIPFRFLCGSICLFAEIAASFSSIVLMWWQHPFFLLDMSSCPTLHPAGYLVNMALITDHFLILSRSLLPSHIQVLGWSLAHWPQPGLASARIFKGWWMPFPVIPCYFEPPEILKIGNKTEQEITFLVQMACFHDKRLPQCGDLIPERTNPYDQAAVQRPLHSFITWLWIPCVR